jgi:hypothetical protein
MKIITAFFLIMLFISPALAQEDILPDIWHALVKTEDGHTIYLDTSDIADTESGTVRFWLMALEGTAPHEKGQYEIDCGKDLFTLHGRIFLEKGLDETGAEVIREPARITVRPSNSIGIIRKRVCEINTPPRVRASASFDECA